jgi:hypothetical protein
MNCWWISTAFLLGIRLSRLATITKLGEQIKPVVEFAETTSTAVAVVSSAVLMVK